MTAEKRVESIPVIHYEELVSEYQESLTTVLRGFRPALDFLETWVHDEDDLLSILNILEAAECAGLKGVSVVVSSGTLDRLDFLKLQEMAAGLGHIRIGDSESGKTLRASFHGKQEELTIHPAYRKKLGQILARVSHEGLLEPENGKLLLEASQDFVRLQVEVDPDRHVVEKAAHSGAGDPVKRGLLEGLCRTLEGRTVQDGSDHGAIYLEQGLRDPAETRPVPGIITPENADPAFLLPRTLSRRLFEDYSKLIDCQPGSNFFELPPSEEWQSLSQEGKVAALKGVVPGVGLDLGLQPEELEILRIDDHVRVTVAFRKQLSGADEQRILMRLEEAIQESIEPALQLYLEERKDLNAIRQLDSSSGNSNRMER